MNLDPSGRASLAEILTVSTTIGLLAGLGVSALNGGKDIAKNLILGAAGGFAVGLAFSKGPTAFVETIIAGMMAASITAIILLIADLVSGREPRGPGEMVAAMFEALTWAVIGKQLGPGTKSSGFANNLYFEFIANQWQSMVEAFNSVTTIAGALGDPDRRTSQETIKGALRKIIASLISSIVTSPINAVFATILDKGPGLRWIPLGVKKRLLDESINTIVKLSTGTTLGVSAIDVASDYVLDEVFIRPLGALFK